MSEFASHIPLAFGAGLISVFSPCVMPLMPAYLSLISGVSVEEMEKGVGDSALRRRVIRACLGFIAGFSTVFILMGIGAVTIGHTVRTWHMDVMGLEIGAIQVVGVLIVLFGLHMTGLVPISFLYRDTRVQVEVKERSLLATYLVGGGFALGWSPCIGPILSSVLALAGSRETVIEGTALLAIYSAGLAVPFLAAGWSIEFFFRAFARMKHHFRRLEVASGVILMAVGGLMATNQFSRLNSQFSFMADFVARAERAIQ
ncbi:MAG: cytochrome c biogenesis CcdA family protein [Myxococcota bacterium]|nr:cytochrome c biogenesis CcdA family protein [Myxococcota bacterium]